MPSALAISALGRSHLRHNRRNPPSICAQGMRQLFPKLRLGPTIMHHALVFVRLAHDRRFVGAVLFVLVVFILVVFIRISGRHCVAHDHEGTPVYQPGGQFFGDVWGHVVAPLAATGGEHAQRIFCSSTCAIETSAREKDCLA